MSRPTSASDAAGGSPGALTLLFPGQGAQKVGMGHALYAQGGAPRRRFEEADAALGVRLSELMFDGPSTLLRSTEYLQPALVTLEVAEADRLRELGVVPVAAIGHSIGQYAALVVAGALGFEDALLLVRERGRLMQAAVPAGRGAMALVVGAARAAVRAACSEVAERMGEVVQVACHNAPAQTVIAGTRAAVEQVLDRVEQEEGVASVDLAVTVPFHCELLAGIVAPFAERVAAVALKEPSFIVYDNVTGRPLTGVAAMREALVRHLTAPVLFEESVRAALAAGPCTFVQCGPGRGLAPLVQALAPEVEVRYLADFEAGEPGERGARGHAGGAS